MTQRKFVPEGNSLVEYREPFYLKTKIIVCVALLSAVVPFVGIIVAVLVGLKSKNFSTHREQLERLAPRALAEANTTAQQIIADSNAEAEKILSVANEQATALTAEAQSRLQTLNAEIELKEETTARIINEATRQAEQYNAAARRELDHINSEIGKREFYLSEVERIKENISMLEKKERSLTEKIDSLMRIRKAVNAAVKNYLSNVPNLSDQMINLPLGLIREVESLVPTVLLKLHSMDYKDLRRAFKGNEKLIEETLSRYEGRYTTKVNRAIYRLMVIALRAELQNILYTLTSSKLDDALAAVHEVANKYMNIAREGNQTISSTLAKFIGELEVLFFDAVKIEYEYFVKREAARQEQLELRAKIREEAEEQRRLKEQQEQMEREASKYTTQIEKLTAQVQSEGDKSQALLDKIKELELQLADLSAKRDEIIKLQNGKAGYVYIISNLGSFGGDVFKVGMTRRLNPQERIDELGSASVPFKFDVHSFIFSEDAVKLESDLHAALDSRRLNKVNLRKEFFKVPIEELERLVEHFDPSAEFNRTMQAEQYYQSLSVGEDYGAGQSS